jgi:nucleotide-binding universal stress UspA family protein
MSAPSPLIAGIDFTASSASVLRHAVHAAAQSGAPVLALHVLDTSKIAHLSATTGEKPTIERITTQAEQKLAALVAAETPGANVRVMVAAGRPTDLLQRSVEEQGASLLVIAANDLTKKRLGSIASQCVRSVPCDVLVLRDWQEGNFKHIAVCTDFSPMSANALARGIEMAAIHQARLDILHVIYPPTRDAWGEVLDQPADATISYADMCRERARRALDDFLAPQREALATIDHHPVILESVSPAEAITFQAQDSGADLVILGTRNQSKLAGYFLGTNAERLIQDATVSALAVRG